MDINIYPDPDFYSDKNYPQNIDELKNSITRFGYAKDKVTFEFVEKAVSKTNRFFEDMIGFIWNEAERGAKEIPEKLRLLDGEGSVILSQRQCLSIISNAFFCTYKDRISDNCMSGNNMPSINFDELYGGKSWGYSEIEKLKMIFNYFKRCRIKLENGDPMNRPVFFIRNKNTSITVDDWENDRSVLILPQMYPLNKSLEEAEGMLKVDFANQIIGGAAIAYGNVQEEIMFCARPELIVSRLICPAMRPDEAIIFIGAEQFSQTEGYGSYFEYSGNFLDTSPMQKNGALSSYITAIDAADFRYLDRRKQYDRDLILRELTKTFAGFNVENTPDHIATGNWGCGIFGGDVELKSIIQWIAASRSGKKMHYYPWSQARVFNKLPELSETLVRKNITTGDLSAFLLNKLQKSNNVYNQIAEHYS